MTSGREGRPARTGGTAVLAGSLSFGVSAWEEVLHATMHQAEGASASHALTHAALAFPLALAAVVAGRRVARRGSPRRAALAIAAIFTVVLVPAAIAHGWLHPAPVNLLHAHSTTLAASLAHGLRDALLGAPAALAIALALGAPRPVLRSLRPRPLAAGLALVAAFSGLPAAQPGFAAPPPAFSVPLPIPPVLTGENITLVAAETDVQIMPGGRPTRMWTYNGTFPGPTIRRRAGQTTRVTLVNNLAAPGAPCQGHDPEHGPITDRCLTLHHHGNHSASSEDGQPDDHLVPPGGSRTYTYDFMEDGRPERAAIQWYHDHRMDVTGRNVWMGLAGMVILEDDMDNPTDPDRIALPTGAYDVPLTVVDRRFDANDQLVYNFTREGVIGNLALVNGAPQPYLEVADRTYRLRVLNASNALPMVLALDDGRPLVQVGTESGLLEKPLVRSRIPLAPAERADILVNFDGALGKNVALQNLAGFGGTAKLMQFRVVRDEVEEWPVPAQLRSVPVFDATQAAAHRTWVFGRDDRTLNWTINDNEFDPSRVDAAPRLDSTEIWTFVNGGNALHVVHIHDVDWKVLSRSYGVPPDRETGLDESGLKESFWLRPFEVVTVMSRFTDHLGRYVLHCHILEHEDRAMMAQFEVV